MLDCGLKSHDKKLALNLLESSPVVSHPIDAHGVEVCGTLTFTFSLGLFFRACAIVSSPSYTIMPSTTSTPLSVDAAPLTSPPLMLHSLPPTTIMILLSLLSLWSHTPRDVWAPNNHPLGSFFLSFTIHLIAESEGWVRFDGKS